MVTKALRGVPTLLVGLLTVAVLFTAYTATQARADHEPANKIAVAGSDIDRVGSDQRVLSETLKVSTTHDLMLHLSAECSILTSLLTGEEAGGAGENTDDAFSFGSVRLRLEIDGQPVPVANDDFTPGTAGRQDDAADTNDGLGDNNIGEVTFCNRAYQRTVADSEDQVVPPGGDGLDTTDDFIRTRTANSFNWVALNVGVDDVEDGTAADMYDGYDNPDNGNNVIFIEVFADFDEAPVSCGREGTPDNDPAERTLTCADAFIGSRTLIAEPTNASIHEQVELDDTDGGS